MKKIAAALLAALLTLLGIVSPAQAASYKTNVTISVPKFAAAGIAVPVDVSVCSLATRSSTTCEFMANRSVTLFANKKKVATATTSYGVASFLWTPASAGKYSLTASVTAASGFKAATTASATSVTISKKTSKTTLTTKYCDSVSCEKDPMTMSFDDDFAQISGLLGKTAAVGKGRSAHLQYVNTKNVWYSYLSSKSALSSEFGQYSVDFSLTFDSTDYCIDGDETYDWRFRILIDGNSKYAPTASPARTITFDCANGSSGGDSGISFTDDYTDKSIDSNYDAVPDITIDVLDPYYTGYLVKTLYCETSCDVDDNWFPIDSFSGSGDDTVTLMADWGEGVGAYSLMVIIYPDDSSPRIEGDSYFIDIY